MDELLKKLLDMIENDPELKDLDPNDINEDHIDKFTEKLKDVKITEIEDFKDRMAIVVNQTDPDMN